MTIASILKDPLAMRAYVQTLSKYVTCPYLALFREFKLPTMCYRLVMKKC